MPHYSELNLALVAVGGGGALRNISLCEAQFSVPPNKYCTVPKSGKLIFAFEQEFVQKFSLCNQLGEHWGVNDQKSAITFNDANMRTKDICYNLLSFIGELDIFHKFY